MDESDGFRGCLHTCIRSRDLGECYDLRSHSEILQQDFREFRELQDRAERLLNHVIESLDVHLPISITITADEVDRGAWTDGQGVYIDIAFAMFVWDEFGTGALFTVIAHEVSHIVLGHASIDPGGVCPLHHEQEYEADGLAAFALAGTRYGVRPVLAMLRWLASSPTCTHPAGEERARHFCQVWRSERESLLSLV